MATSRRTGEQVGVGEVYDLIWDMNAQLVATTQRLEDHEAEHERNEGRRTGRLSRLNAWGLAGVGAIATVGGGFIGSLASRGHL